jgi:purine-nucleoside phosphorylase
MTRLAETGDAFDRVEQAAATLGPRLGGAVPTIAVVLGSGLGGFVDRLRDHVVVPYDELPGWPGPTVAGHAGRLVAGEVAGRRVLVLSGRVHLYEGRSPNEVTFATRVLARAGVRHLVLTNAAGGINTGFCSGTLMVIDDHINLMGTNPLSGPNDARFGPRFPDMTEVYSRRLRAVADEASRSCGVPVAHGVYLAVTGPSYETPAEIRAFRTLGADAVGMSTVPEAIVARHMDVEVLAISCIANLAAGMEDVRLSEQDVLDAASRAQTAFGQLLEAILVRV